MLERANQHRRSFLSVLGRANPREVVDIGSVRRRLSPDGVQRHSGALGGHVRAGSAPSARRVHGYPARVGGGRGRRQTDVAGQLVAPWRQGPADAFRVEGARGVGAALEGAVRVQQSRAVGSVLAASPPPPSPLLLQAVAAEYELSFELNGKRA